MTLLCILERHMDINSISGARTFRFLEQFDYIRAAGTAAEKNAAQTIFSELKQMGLAPRIHRFSFSSYDVREARLIVTKPFTKEYTVTGYVYSHNTPPEGLKAEFIFVEEGDDVSLSKARGKIAMISHQVHAGDYEKLEQAGAVGFISVTGTPLDQGADRIPMEYHVRNIKSPQLTGLNLHYCDARELVERGAEEVTIILRQQTTVIRSQNVTVRIPGSNCPQDILALSAHYDSVSAGKGAYDNMSGAAIVMEICRYFAQHPPQRTLEFLFLGAEERGLKGSQAFLAEHQPELHRYQLNLNVDLAGQLVGGTVLGVTAGEDLCALLDKLVWQCGIGARIRQSVWTSDSNSFALHGIPAVTLDRDGFGMHTRYDTIDLISAWALERDARLLAYVADCIDKMDTLTFERHIPGTMQIELERYFRE